MAWRAWRLASDPSGVPSLRAIGDEHRLEVAFLTGPDAAGLCPRQPAGGCPRSQDGRVPGESCGCGIYAFATRDQLYASGYRPGNGVVAGEVELHGKVLASHNKRRTTTVLRASSVRVLRLIAGDDTNLDSVRAIAADWNVPLEVPTWVRLPAIVHRVVADSPVSGDRQHGENHWRAVAATAVDLLGYGTNREADPLIVFLFAVLHDARSNPRRDHGTRAAQYALRLQTEGVLDLEPLELDTLAYALACHSDGLTSDNPTVAVCWDSDRLHLPRAGARPSPRLLSTETARRNAAHLARNATAKRQQPPTWQELIPVVKVLVRQRKPKLEQREAA